MKVIKTILLIIFLSNNLVAQENESPSQFLGIRPYITVEPFYKQNELDINLLPAIYQINIGKSVGLRFASLLNLGIRNDETSISNIGFQVGLPIYLNKREQMNAKSEGFYFAPSVGFTRNIQDYYNNTTIYLEPGYQLSIGENMTMQFGIELGATYFNYTNNANEDKWTEHFGLSIVLGWWI